MGKLSYAILVLVSMWGGLALAQAPAAASAPGPTLRHLMSVAREAPYYALDWHELKLIANDASAVARLKDALQRSRRSDASEQSLWIDAAAGRPEGVLAFYDANVRNRPDDKTLPNAACWARAAHGIDREHMLAVCDAAVAADPKSYSRLNRGKARLQLGLNELALSDFDAVLADRTARSGTMMVDAVFGRGLARARMGDGAGSNDMRLAARADPQVRVRFADLEPAAAH